MKIGIDAILLLSQAPTATGIQYYIENLINNLAIIDRKNEYILYGYSWHNYYSETKKLSFPSFPNFTLRLRKIPAKLIKFLYKYNIPFEFLFGAIDIQHIHSPQTLCFRRKKKVITVHDLTYELFPQWHTRGNILRYRNTYISALKKMDKIIAVSENTKNDLINLYKIVPERIKVIYEAADEIYCPTEDPERFAQIKRKYGLPDRFILFVGVIEPRKNIVRLIKAYHQLKGGIQQKLVIVGKKGWLYDDVFKTVERLNLKKDIIFLGYIPKEDLVFLYNVANLFIYPSLYEGFGLPPLEAMACGVPVVTSNISSLPEVVGDAAISVNPYSVEEMAEAIKKVLSDKELQQEMRQKGLERAKLFSWEKTARETIKVYEELGESK